MTQQMDQRKREDRIADLMNVFDTAVKNFQKTPNPQHALAFDHARERFTGYLKETVKSLKGTLASESFGPIAGFYAGYIARESAKVADRPDYASMAAQRTLPKSEQPNMAVWPAAAV